MMKHLFILSFLFCPMMSFCGELLDCQLLPENRGCLYLPDSSKTYSNVLVFLRGKFEGNAVVPKEDRERAALQALESFGLKEKAKQLDAALFVTGSPHYGLLKDDIESLATRKFVTSDSGLYLASHSGGYMGLWRTLESYESEPKRLLGIFMLDNFYSRKEPFLVLLKSVVGQGVRCIGFLTDHNVERFESLYKKIPCKADGPEGFSHSGSVSTCLDHYLAGKETCPSAP